MNAASASIGGIGDLVCYATPQRHYLMPYGSDWFDMGPYDPGAVYVVIGTRWRHNSCSPWWNGMMFLCLAGARVGWAYADRMVIVSRVRAAGLAVGS